ncbi:MAG: alpha/beta hydrolase [Pseudomonadota bacterium]
MAETCETIRVPGVGLTMEAKRWGESSDRTPVICLPGLTRNAADFEDLAAILSGAGREVIAFSLRGRAGSDYADDHRTYNALVYRDDIIAGMDALGVPRAIFIGTSLGGIVTMLINEEAPDRVAAAVINDIGPDLGPEGIARIVGYVSARKPGASVATLEDAAAQIKEINEQAFPGRDDAFWRLFATRTFREEETGWVLDYDPRIAQAFADGPPAPELWPAFEKLRDTPTLVVRGALSDLLTPPILETMRGVNPTYEFIEVANVGHAPTLTEPEALEKIQALVSAAP